MLYLLSSRIAAPLACSRLSETREDAKVKGKRKVGGAGKGKRKGRPSSPQFSPVLRLLVLWLRAKARLNRQTRAILECSVVTYLAIIKWGWVGGKGLCRSRRVLSTSDILCVFLHFFRAVLVRNSATSSSDSRKRHFLVQSWIIANVSRAWKQGWSMAYFPCSLVSNQIYHRSTSFPMKCSIESMVYCSHLPNMVSTSWPLSQSEKGAYFGWIIKAVVVQNQSCQAEVCWR